MFSYQASETLTMSMERGGYQLLKSNINYKPLS